MTMRIKTRWHKDKQRGLDEIAGALGFIVWRIGANSLLELENEGFVTYSNAHRLDIMAEILCFLLQAADRIAYERGMELEDRAQLVNALGLHLAGTFAENQQDLFGPGDYKAPFIDLLNRRAEEYSELSFSDGEAKLDFLRHFGDRVAEILGEKNRHWASQHIIELDGPQAVKALYRAMQEML